VVQITVLLIHRVEKGGMMAQVVGLDSLARKNVQSAQATPISYLAW
jgi:hypothetical protein